MKKTIMGALCAIALTLSFTSCEDAKYVNFSDIKEVCTTYDDHGIATAHYAIINVDGKDDVMQISGNAKKVLTSECRKATDTIRFEYRHGLYMASVSQAHTESIKLN